MSLDGVESDLRQGAREGSGSGLLTFFAMAKHIFLRVEAVRGSRVSVAIVHGQPSVDRQRGSERENRQKSGGVGG